MADIDLRVSGKKFVVLDSSGAVSYTIPVETGLENQALILDAENNLVFADAGFQGRSLATIDDVDSTIDQTAVAGESLIWSGTQWIADSAGGGVDSEGVFAIIDSAYIQAFIGDTYLSTVVNEAYIESKIGGSVNTQVTTLVDADYVRGYANEPYIKGIVDSDYIKTAANESYVKGIVDSDHLDLLNTKQVNIGPWTLRVNGSNNLIASYNSNDVFELNTTGQLTVLNDVVAFGIL